MQETSTQNKRKIVVKIGSSTLTDSESTLDWQFLHRLARELHTLVSEGWQPVVVTSAAIACGLNELGMNERPKDMPSLQAAASVGQCALIKAYSDVFSKYSMTASLVLLTRHDTAERGAYLHARDAMMRLLDFGCIPIVNENDTVSVEQIRFGDNDTLAAVVACLIGADMVVILSDIDGLYSANPKTDKNAHIVSRVDTIDQALLDSCGGAGSSVGSGGMVTKVRAARVLMAAGIPMVIAAGDAEGAILAAAHGKEVGTLFAPNARKHEITPRKLWIALGDSVRGVLHVDAGARRAICESGSSILPVGITAVEGQFSVHDIVDVVDEQGFVFARGMVQFESDEIDLGRGRSSAQLEANRLLAPLAQHPVVHRDDLMVF